MALYAIGRSASVLAQELSIGLAAFRVAFCTLHIPMRDVQREPRFVVAESGHLPLTHRVTCRTVLFRRAGTELAVVCVLMAAKAIRGNQGEARDRLGGSVCPRRRARGSLVAARTRHLLMRALQRKLGLGVLEGQHLAPSLHGVTRLAGLLIRRCCVVRILVAGGAVPRFEVILTGCGGARRNRDQLAHNLSRGRHARRQRLMTSVASHGRVRALQNKPRHRMPGG